ncbi:MAG: hypothetical protein J6A04_00350 [Clostridia bacterium]|nr:hypothetical protein [Clostridia bacterium]
MAKIGSQNRLLIPKELTDLLKISGTVGIFWDEAEKKIYLNHIEKCEEEFCICVRNIDNKNRICLPNNILSLIGANRKSEFVIAVKKYRIYIFKAEENRD